jgi:hypothetical protein
MLRARLRPLTTAILLVWPFLPCAASFYAVTRWGVADPETTAPAPPAPLPPPRAIEASAPLSATSTAR